MVIKKAIQPQKGYMADNAGGRTRTDTSLSSLDFESSASTDFTTPAKASLILAYLS